MPNFNWTCPYCGHGQVVTDNSSHTVWRKLQIAKLSTGETGFEFKAISCLNEDCKMLTLVGRTTEVISNDRGSEWAGRTKNFWKLLPEYSFKVQPDYVPDPIKSDYYEACRIRELSPKASATLSRRCLQGMIRDFTGVIEKTLFKEIGKLRDLLDQATAPAGVTEEGVAALDHIRSIGNIGAHMEADINQIVDVDPDEARALTDVIELLFEEWYVARHTRQQRLQRIALIAEEKQIQRLPLT